VRGTWHGRTVLITGVCGTVGRELLRQTVALSPSEIIGIDNNESELFFLREEYGAEPMIQLFVGDIRDGETMKDRMRGVDVVLHAAALKHVFLCEQSPRDALRTNIIGTQNIIDAAIANGVKRVLFTSSDKAVNPTNVMGTSKLMAERLMSANNAMRRADGPIFASTRFGNVLGSRGSVIPLFRRQIAQGGPVTITDEAMTRFIMTLEQAVSLVLSSAVLAHGGEVFVTKMPVLGIKDLAEVMIEELAPGYGFARGDIGIEIVGPRPGEKLYEELLNDEETRRTVETEDFFIILPALKPHYETVQYAYLGMLGNRVERPYNSALVDAMSKEEVRAYLRRNDLLGSSVKGEELKCAS
jgi:FlaA1/EpsC-like NDP-sugar epimerase